VNDAKIMQGEGVQAPLSIVYDGAQRRIKRK